MNNFFDFFSRPSSLAVVGASADPAKWGYWLTHGALKGGHRRSVYLVNRSGIKIAGVDTYKSISDLPEIPDLVTISVPGDAVSGVIREALKLGVRAFLVISARVPDTDEILEMLREHGARMVGPNSLGVYSAQGDLQLMWGEMRPGSLAIVSQSGQLGSEIAAIGAKQGIGISRFISLGNQADIDAVDVLHSLKQDAFTKTVGIYLEDFSNGIKVFEAIRELRESGIAVVLLTTGESEASKELAHTHTGAMTSESTVIDAACREAGAMRVYTPTDLVQVASLTDKDSVPKGNRVAIISDSGGQGGIAADAAERVGLTLPELSSRLRAEIEAVLPLGASSRNPIDLAGAGEKDLELYSKLPALLAASGEVDAVVLSGYFGSYGQDTPLLIETEREVANELMQITEVPVLVHAMAEDSMVSLELSLAKIPVTDRVEDLMHSLAGAIRSTAAPRLHTLAEEETEEQENEQPGLKFLEDPLEMRFALEERGIPFAESRIVTNEEEVEAVTEELGGVLVLKAAWLPHKTEYDGVKLGLMGAEETKLAWQEMYSRLGPGNYTLEVQDTREFVAEYIVSARKDPSFGTIITVGFGGTETELWQDIIVEKGPVDRDHALAMLGTLKSAPLLDEWRGRPPLDSWALAGVVADLSKIVDEAEDISEIELNPVRVGVHDAIAVDCLTQELTDD